MCVRVYTCAHVCVEQDECVCVCTHVPIRVWSRMYGACVCTCVPMCVWSRMNVCVCAYTCAHVCVEQDACVHVRLCASRAG